MRNALFKLGGDDMEGDAEAIAERLQVGGVCFVMNILHPYMQGLDGKVRDMDLGTTGEKFQQAEGILATRQTDEDAVVLVDKLELSQRFVKLFPKSFV